MRRPRTALLRRGHRGWLATVPPRRALRRSWSKPIAGGRRVYTAAPVGAILALRPMRILARSRLYAVSSVTQLVRGAAPPLPRSGGVVYTFAATSREEARRGAPPHGPLRREARHGSPAGRAYTHMLVERERFERHMRTETMFASESPVVRGPEGLPGPPGSALRGPGGPQGPAGRVLTLVRSAATPALSTSPEPDAVPDAAAGTLEASPPPGPTPFGAAAPDVDALARQVFDRIERRAIAQRERMGRI